MFIKITENYIEFNASGMDTVRMSEVIDFIEIFCKSRNIDSQGLMVKGNNDIPYVRYYFPEGVLTHND